MTFSPASGRAGSAAFLPRPGGLPGLTPTDHGARPSRPNHSLRTRLNQSELRPPASAEVQPGNVARTSNDLADGWLTSTNQPDAPLRSSGAIVVVEGKMAALDVGSSLAIPEAL